MFKTYLSRPSRSLSWRQPAVRVSRLQSFAVCYPQALRDSATVDPPISEALPSDGFQLKSSEQKVGAAEDALYDQQVEAVSNWWKSSRYEGIKRPYSAEDVVSKRGSLQQNYPSSIMARKLFNLLDKRAQAGEPVHTRK